MAWQYIILWSRTTNYVSIGVAYIDFILKFSVAKWLSHACIKYALNVEDASLQ